jgi:hypothetical protein
MFRTIPRVNLPFCPGVSFSLNGWWGCFFFDVLPVFFPPFVVLAAFPRVLLPFASRIIVIASFVLLLLLLNQIQISNPFGNKKNAHESTPKLSKKKENALSLSHSERDRTLSLSLSFKIVYSFVSFVSFVANRRRCNKHTADPREKR